jgi:hypothetical protein
MFWKFEGEKTFGIKTTATLDLTLATKRTLEESKPVKEVNRFLYRKY